MESDFCNKMTTARSEKTEKKKEMEEENGRRKG